MGHTAIVSLLLGIVLLLLGRRLFWFFVGAAGFLVGMDIANVKKPTPALCAER